MAAVDTNGWIHRACYSCADKIYMNEPTELYINYCINLCKLLQKYKIIPILVFDGQSLPAKSQTKLQRKQRKQQIRESIEELLRAGHESRARFLMRQCVDVTFDMVRKVIERCRQEKIDYLVSPYEADAQICYLVNNKFADYAISEDSDLLVFGCKKVLYKLSRDTKKGVLVDLARMEKCFKNFNLLKFQLMCILSGCDYVENIPGIGIARSKRFFEELSKSVTNENIRQILLMVPNILNMANKIKITEEYIDDFIRAFNTFNHQIVYSPKTGDLIHLNSVKNNVNVNENELNQYAGKFFDQDLIGNGNSKFVKDYVLGNICPETLKIIDNYDPSSSNNQSILFSTILCKQTYFQNCISSKDEKKEDLIQIEKHATTSSGLENCSKKPKMESNSVKADLNENDHLKKKTNLQEYAVVSPSIQKRYNRKMFAQYLKIGEKMNGTSKHFKTDDIQEEPVKKKNKFI